MITYFDRILYLYPNIQGVLYWQTQSDGTPWPNPYSGIVWENTTITQPSQSILDALDPTVVQTELTNRQVAADKLARDNAASTDLAILASYQLYCQLNKSTITLSQYLDQLEATNTALT